MSITYGPIYPMLSMLCYFDLVMDLHTTQLLDLATVPTSHRIAYIRIAYIRLNYFSSTFQQMNSVFLSQ